MLDPHPHLKSFRIRIEKNSRSGSAKNESVSTAMDGTQNVLDHTLDLNLTEKKIISLQNYSDQISLQLPRVIYFYSNAMI